MPPEDDAVPTDEELLRTLQQYQIEFDAGDASADRCVELLADTMTIQQELRRRGVTDLTVAAAIAAVTQRKESDPPFS